MRISAKADYAVRAVIELAAVRDLPPEQLVYDGAARHLPAVWCRVHATLHELLDGVTVADLAGADTPSIKI